jgi:hypothetical protein
MNQKRPKAGRPRVIAPDAERVYVKFSPAIARQVRAMALEERRTMTAQVEMLVERGLRAYGLETSVA